MIDNAQFGPGGPIDVASRWTKAVLKDRDLGTAWPLMEPELRREYVRAWMEVNTSHPMMLDRDPQKLCDALVADDPTNHPLWSGFAMLLVDEFHEKWTHINPEHCGFLTSPRPIDLDRELVLYVDKGTPDPVVIGGAEGEEAEFRLPLIGFIMRHGDEGWLVEDFDLDGRFAGGRLGV